jgi:hypothetical protein
MSLFKDLINSDNTESSKRAVMVILAAVYVLINLVFIITHVLITWKFFPVPATTISLFYTSIDKLLLADKEIIEVFGGVVAITGVAGLIKDAMGKNAEAKKDIAQVNKDKPTAAVHVNEVKNVNVNDGESSTLG